MLQHTRLINERKANVQRGHRSLAVTCWPQTCWSCDCEEAAARLMDTRSVQISLITPATPPRGRLVDYAASSQWERKYGRCRNNRSHDVKLLYQLWLVPELQDSQVEHLHDWTYETPPVIKLWETCSVEQQEQCQADFSTTGETLTEPFVTLLHSECLDEWILPSLSLPCICDQTTTSNTEAFVWAFNPLMPGFCMTSCF